MNYGFLGFGTMANAIYQGMVESEQFDNCKIYAYDIKRENLNLNKPNFFPTVTEFELCEKADVTILCVKPQNLADLLPHIKPFVSGKLLLTIAVGKDFAFYESLLGENQKLIRIMPNINAKVKGAISAICANNACDDEDITRAENIFATIGSVVSLKEELFPTFAAVAGSSVAFCYMYIDALIKFMVKNNVSEDLAREIAANSVIGSGKLVLGSMEEPLNLTKQVCSPGGTTIEGVKLLEENNFEDNLINALNAILAKDEILRRS